jgi:hypothetical protein
MSRNRRAAAPTLASLVRLLLLLAGLWTAGYGVLLLSKHPPRDLVWIAVWFAGGILAHDAVFAPLCAALGLGARLLLPRRWWAPAACGAVCTVTLLLVAAPVIGRRHAHPDNPTVLDRDYPAGLTIALLAVWALVVGAHLTARRGRPHAWRSRQSAR